MGMGLCPTHASRAWEPRYNDYCIVPENIHITPTEGIGNSWGVGGSRRPINLSKCMKLDWIEFPVWWGGGGQGKIPSMGWVWIIFGATHLV